VPRIHALGPVRRLFSQEVARVNAAQACVRLQHDRRQRRDLEIYLEEQRKPPVGPRPSGGR
jgi:hypothetical protein